ncbi:C-type lectin lectoxin-Lio2-like [Amphiura filiformis]|uniref:C-type lectin lectoxin-Lio2-like n=1 Tax=Amphiura filiformis TaxID=82378 RepID=UPI003B2231A7
MKIAIIVLGLFTCAATAQLVCDEAWTLLGDSCYKTFRPEPEGEDSQEARTCCTQPYGKSVCESFGAHLADIKSQTEQTNVVNWLTSINSKDVWLGLYSPIPGGDLFHSDDTPLGSYTAWSSTGRNGQVSCVRMEQTENEQFKWSDRECDWKYGFLCEKEATSG